MNAAPWMSRQTDPVVDFLRMLVEIESPSFDTEASERIATPLSERLAAIGGAVRRIRTDAGTSILADFGAGPDPLLLVGHTDTVWPRGTLDQALPWSHDGTVIRGPGAYDMKSGIAVMCEALERIGGAPAMPVRVILTCDEEVGSPTTASLITQEAVGARAAIGFESPHPDGALKVGRRGSTRVIIRAVGRSAHAALDPELGISAIDELVDQLMRVRMLVEDPALSAPVLCNIGTVAGGTRANVVPDVAEAEIGLRFIDGESETAVLNALDGLAPIRHGSRLEVETLSSRPAWHATASDAALTATIASTAASLGQRIDGRPAAGAGDTNLLGSLRIPTVDGFGPRGGGAHALDEHVIVESLRERIDLLTALLSSA